MSVTNQDTCATQNHRLSEGAKQAETQIDTKVDLDTILVNELGAFGKYHVRTLALAVFALMFCGFHSEYVFTSARINTRCLISECEDRGSEFSPAWIHGAIPTKAGSLEKCYRYGTNNITSTSWNDTCNVIFNTSAVQKCEERVYENKQTVVYDFDLGCDEWRRTIIGSARMIGSVFSLSSTGFISDRWGRRTALVINCVNSGWIGVTRYWINWYPLFVLSGFFEAFFGAGMFSSAYLLILELMAPKHRTFAGGFVGVCYALGHILLGLIAWNLQYWRAITLALYVPHLFGIGYLWAVPESIRWYVSKGRYTESENQLKKMAKMNKKDLSAKSLELLRVNAEEEKLRKQEEIIQKYQEPCLVSLVFRHKTILIRCLLVPFCWITGYLVYFGLSINSVNISGNNKYLNYITVTSVEIPGLFLAIYLPNKIGRKKVLAGSFWICAACQCAYVFMPKDMYWLSLCIYLVGKCTSSMIMSTLYVFTSELFPTKYRHSLLAYCATVGKIGSAMAPLTPAFGASTFPEMPFVLFGIFALVAGCLVLPLPETLRRKLPDSLEEAEAL